MFLAKLEKLEAEVVGGKVGRDIWAGPVRPKWKPGSPTLWEECVGNLS